MIFAGEDLSSCLDNLSRIELNCKPNTFRYRLVRLNANSPVPLYRQLADRLLADIDGGAYGVESKIPSEHELAERF